MISDGSKLYKIGTDALPTELADIPVKVAELVFRVAGFQLGSGGCITSSSSSGGYRRLLAHLYRTGSSLMRNALISSFLDLSALM